MVYVLDPRDPRAIRLLSYYRDAELRGAGLLLHMAAQEEQPAACAALTRHIADETRHAWWITKRIADLGATPEQVPDGYQTRMARAGGIPRTLLELYAVTLVAEERARARYTAHLASGCADADTADLLRQLSADEVWHLDWVRRRLREFADEVGEDAVDDTVRRFRTADAAVTADLAALEHETFGFAVTPVPSDCADL